MLLPRLRGLYSGLAVMGAGMAGIGVVAGTAQLSGSRSAPSASGNDAESDGAAAVEAVTLLNGHDGAAKEGTSCQGHGPAQGHGQSAGSRWQ